MSEPIKTEIVALLPKLRRFAYALAGDVSEGDDVVQAACEKALARLDQYQPGTRLDSWMFRIVRTTFLDGRRRHERRFADSEDSTMARLSDDGVAQRRDEDRMLLANVRAAMSALPDDQRAALALVAIEGLSYREAAHVLDVPIGTIMSRLGRARAKLRPLSEGAFS